MSAELVTEKHIDLSGIIAATKNINRETTKLVKQYAEFGKDTKITIGNTAQIAKDMERTNSTLRQMKMHRFDNLLNAAAKLMAAVGAFKAIQGTINLGTQYMYQGVTAQTMRTTSKNIDAFNYMLKTNGLDRMMGTGNVANFAQQVRDPNSAAFKLVAGVLGLKSGDDLGAGRFDGITLYLETIKAMQEKMKTIGGEFPAAIYNKGINVKEVLGFGLNEFEMLGNYDLTAEFNKQLESIQYQTDVLEDLGKQWADLKVEFYKMGVTLANEIAPYLSEIMSVVKAFLPYLKDILNSMPSPKVSPEVKEQWSRIGRYNGSIVTAFPTTYSKDTDDQLKAMQKYITEDERRMIQALLDDPNTLPIVVRLLNSGNSIRRELVNNYFKKNGGHMVEADVVTKGMSADQLAQLALLQAIGSPNALDNMDVENKGAFLRSLALRNMGGGRTLNTTTGNNWLDNAVKSIISHEGFSSKKYWDANASGKGGAWAIGHGVHYLDNLEADKREQFGLVGDNPTISREQAAALSRYLIGHDYLPQAEQLMGGADKFAALPDAIKEFVLDVVYNAGAGNAKSFKFMQQLQAGDINGALESYMKSKIQADNMARKAHNTELLRQGGGKITIDINMNGKKVGSVDDALKSAANGAAMKINIG